MLLSHCLTYFERKISHALSEEIIFAFCFSELEIFIRSATGTALVQKMHIHQYADLTEKRIILHVLLDAVLPTTIIQK